MRLCINRSLANDWKLLKSILTLDSSSIRTGQPIKIGRQFISDITGIQKYGEKHDILFSLLHVWVEISNLFNTLKYPKKKSSIRNYIDYIKVLGSWRDEKILVFFSQVHISSSRPGEDPGFFFFLKKEQSALSEFESKLCINRKLFCLIVGWLLQLISLSKLAPPPYIRLCPVRPS